MVARSEAKTPPLSYLNIASIMFLEPEVACIGMCM